MTSQEHEAVLRILDANCNRLREALRVVEEHFRFVHPHKETAVCLKNMRHSLQTIEEALGKPRLLEARAVSRDPFSYEMREEEQVRTTPDDVMAANLKRGQEAARVIEEYTKSCNQPACASRAKSIRFSLYELEKSLYHDTFLNHGPTSKKTTC